MKDLLDIDLLRPLKNVSFLEETSIYDKVHHPEP